jgi:hypothetical protein
MYQSNHYGIDMDKHSLEMAWKDAEGLMLILISVVLFTCAGIVIVLSLAHVGALSILTIPVFFLVYGYMRYRYHSRQPLRY